MEKIKYRLKGHESFVLRDGWLTKGLRAVNSNSKVYSVNSGADALGMGTNMAKSIRYWMKTAGITTEHQNKGVTLTELGKIIFEHDLYIEDIFTLWVLHSNIVQNFENATSWHMFFNYMDFSSAFNREEMQNLMTILLEEHTGVNNLSERSIRDDCAAIVSMYAQRTITSDDPEEKRISPFEEIGLLVHSGTKFIKKRPDRDKIDELLILYLIIEKLNTDERMSIDYLTEGINMPGKVFNLNRISVNDYLDKLQNKEYIIVNRTAGLDIIYPKKCLNMRKEDVVREYYERSGK